MGSLGIAIITNIPTPYRKTQWEFWRRAIDKEITVFYCARKKAGRLWNVNRIAGVSEVFLKGLGLKGIFINPGIMRVILKKYDYFIVGGYGFPTVMMAILLLRMMRKKYVLAIDGVPPAVVQHTNRGAINIIRKFFIQSASAYLVSGSTGKSFCQRFGVPEEKIFNQYLTVDVEDFISRQVSATESRKEIRNILGIDENQIVVMYCGRLEKEKGIHDLIEAVINLRQKGNDIVALIVGDGSYREALQQQVSGSPGCARFAGHIDPSEIHEYYYASDVFVLPTYRDHWGLVVNEAMACGLPVIVSDCAGCYLDLVFENQNGYVFKAGDVESLADALSLLTDVQLRKRLGYRSREIIMQWTNHEGADEFRRMTHSLLAPNR